MKPFKTIRLAYLDELEGDEGVQNALEAASREEWMTAKEEGVSGWTEEFLKLKNETNASAAIRIDGHARIKMNIYLRIRIGRLGEAVWATADNPKTVYYYLPSKDYLFAYNPEAFPKVKDNIDLILAAIKSNINSSQDVDIAMDDIIKT